MAIDFPLSSSASLLLTTNIHEVIRVIDIHWATVEADDIKCVMLARGSGDLTHAPVLCACIRARYAHCTSRPLRTLWYIDDWSLPLSLKETTKLLVFKNPSVFLSKLVIHRVDDYSPAVRQSFHASRKRATFKRTLVLLVD